MRTVHVRYTLVYSILMMLASIPLKIGGVHQAPFFLVVVGALASLLAYVPMKSCFKSQEFLSLGWTYAAYSLLGFGPVLPFILQSKNYHGDLPWVMSLLGGWLCLTLYSLPAWTLTKRTSL